MKTYTISKLAETPDWSAVPVLRIDVPYLQTQQDVRAYAQIGYNDNALLLHQWIDVPVIRAQEHGPFGTPCEDSCLEFFFQPVPGDDRYINLEFNFNGCYFLGVGTGLQDLLRLIPEGDANLFSADTRKTETGWEIFYQIPFDFIRRIFPNVKLEAGSEIRANCFACSDLTVPHYYLSWNPVEGEVFTFHQSQSFGFMKLSIT